MLRVSQCIRHLISKAQTRNAAHLSHTINIGNSILIAKLIRRCQPLTYSSDSSRHLLIGYNPVYIIDKLLVGIVIKIELYKLWESRCIQSSRQISQKATALAAATFRESTP